MLRRNEVVAAVKDILLDTCRTTSPHAERVAGLVVARVLELTQQQVEAEPKRNIQYFADIPVGVDD